MYFVSCFSFPIGERILALLCPESLLHEPFKFKLRSVEEKETWETSVGNFNAIIIGDNSEIDQLSCRMMTRKKEIILNGMKLALKRKRMERYTRCHRVFLQQKCPKSMRINRKSLRAV